MRKFFIFLLLAMTTTQVVFAANLVSSVDREQVGEDETVNLTISVDDAGVGGGSPDLTGLTSNFQILSQHSSSSTTMINGNYNSKKEWHYTLLPLKTGKLLIPSFKLKNLISDAIEIEVMPAGSTTNNNSKNNGDTDTAKQGDLFIEQKIDKTEAYVQEAMTLTLRIFTAVQIARPEIPTPALPDFMVENLGQAEYQTRQNNRNYYVLEYKYGLFPNKSGKIVLPKQRYQINQVIDNGPRSLFDIQGFGSPTTQTRFLSTPELTLTIKPQPDNLPAPYWLPSEGVNITDNWPDQQAVDAGTPLTRSIEITATGNLAAHIPPLPALNINGLKSYAEQPELTNTHTADHFVGKRKESIAIVPTQPGTYILPAIQLHWWDTKAKQFRSSTLPERTLSVKGTATVTPTSPTQTPGVTPQPLPQDQSTAINPSLVDSAPATATPFYMNVYVWMGTATFFIVLWIVTLIVILKRKSNATEIVSSAEAARQQSLKDAFKQLKMACTANDAKKVREGLIHWAQLQWPDADISTLQQVKQQINNAQFSKLADELDGALYRDAASWDGKAMLAFLQTTKITDSTDKNEVKLPNLYS